MKETTLPKSNYTNQSAQYCDAELQVDSISTSSRQDEQDSDDCETDGAIVIANEANLPSFGSVSVVNSNDVHFGNKTVYQGPVTIKQFLYPNGAVPNEGVSVLEECVNKIDLSSLSINGIVNSAFVKDTSVVKDTVDKVSLQDNTSAQPNLPSIRKALLWLQNLPKQHTRDIVIFFTVLLVSLTILTVVMYWKHPTHSIDNNADSDTDEQDNNSPVDFSLDSNITINKKLRMVSRPQWLAQPPIKPTTPLKTPVPLVIIQHTATAACASQAQCVFHVRNIQQYHIESNNWLDIGYNFLVGGDGSAYEGRGWKSVGAHTLGYNDISIGVGFIGTFSSIIPPLNQIVAFKKLVEIGVQQGYIQKDYKIIAARQVHGTESPGAAFYKEIQTWPHWSKEP